MRATIDPRGSALVSDLIRGLSRIQGKAVKKSNPLYAPLITAIIREARLSRRFGLFQTAVFFSTCKAFYSRPGEFLGKQMSHLQFIPGAMLWHHSRGPKAHKDKAAPYGVCSRANAEEAYDLLREYIGLLYPTGSQPTDPLFPATTADTEGTVTPSSFLTRDTAVHRLQHLLKAAGVPDTEGYTGQAARRGAISDANPTIPWLMKRLQGHWAAESTTPQVEYDAVSCDNRLRYF